RRAWGKAPEMIALIRRQRSKGMKVTADQYPYIASSTSLTATVIPARFREGSAKDLLARLNDSDIGPRVRKAIEAQIDGRQGGKSIRIAGYAPRPDWQGQSLFALAAKEKRPMLDIVLEMQRKGGASVVLFGMHEEEVRLFMRE